MKLINAINKVKSPDSTRHAISNIYLDKENQKIVATDGVCMTVLEPNETIPQNTCLSIPKLPGKELDINMSTYVATNEKGLSAPCKVDVVSQYPDWKMVLPTKIEHTFYLDAELLARVVDSLSSSKDTMIKIELGTDYTPIRVSNAVNDNYGIIMPIRADKFEEIKNRNRPNKAKVAELRSELKA